MLRNLSVALAMAGACVMASSETMAQTAPLTPDDSNVFGRLYHAYADEFGKPPVSDPSAPPSRRPAPFPPQPVDSPPYPFTDWPYGGASTVGASLPNAVNSPLMKAIGPTPVGKALEDAHIQIYGWGNVGGNVSTAKTGYAGNAPASYMYTPNLVHLDQAVVYVERVPDTVQRDHIDWGFRLSGIYGENYRYTTALGVFSNQLLYHNHYTGVDTPMVYGEVYIPYFAQGMVIRVGRYISLPDIEAQLAPNNYMYSHSLTYAVDNYTNTGAIATLKINNNWMAQLGVSAGTETVPWNAKIVSLPNGYVGKRDPGTQPSLTACVQYQTDTANDNVYLCANSINNGTWGYNNLQWYGGTYYHKFDDQWHISLESYYMYQKNVPDKNLVGTTGSPFQYMVNPPNQAVCSNGASYCTAAAYSFLGYLNYKVSPLDNLTLRAEFFNDLQGQRTNTQTRYVNAALGLQHWFSPSIEARPEVAYYHSIDNPAFDNGTKKSLVIVSGDIIVHF